MVHKRKLKEEDLPLVETFNKKFYKVRETKNKIIIKRKSKFDVIREEKRM